MTGRTVAVGDVAIGKPTVEALASVYRSEHLKLVRIAHLITGSNIAAEDLVHDAFEATLKRWDGVNDPAGYLYTAVVNRSRSFLRRRKLENRHTRREPGVSLPPEIDEVWEALKRIPERRRTALVLAYYADLPIDQIARLMNAAPGTVKSLIHRGKLSLQEALDA